MPLPKGHDNPVYPQPIQERGQVDQRQAKLRGITLLDQFAMAALPIAQAQLSSLEASYLNRPPVARHGSVAQVAALAYDLAEALLTERLNRLAPSSTPTPAA